MRLSLWVCLWGGSRGTSGLKRQWTSYLCRDFKDIVYKDSKNPTLSTEGGFPILNDNGYLLNL